MPSTVDQSVSRTAHAVHIFSHFSSPTGKKKKKKDQNVVIKLVRGSPKSSSVTSGPGQPTGASRKKKLQNLTRHIPVKHRDKHPHMHTHVAGEEGKMKDAVSLPLLRRLQLRPRVCARQRCEDSRTLPLLLLFFSSFLASLPRRVYSSQPPRIKK